MVLITARHKKNQKWVNMDFKNLHEAKKHNPDFYDFRYKDSQVTFKDLVR